MGAETISKNTGELKIHKSRRNLFAVFIIASLAFSSCTVTRSNWITYSTIPVKLDAYSNKENITNKKVALMVCNDDRIPKHDLKNIELEDYIKKALVPKGYTFTDKNEDANIVIFYEYGISDPRYYTSEKIVPIWGVTGIGSSITTTSVQRGIITGKPYLQQSTFNTPSYGKIGERVVTETTTKYLCWANISAYDADYYRKIGEDKMLWLTEITSETKNDNLREIFPYMMAAAKEHIGQSRIEHYIISSYPVDRRIIELKSTLVTIRLNEATKGKNDPLATVYQDVYRDNELIIRAGTPVKMIQRKVKYGALKNLVLSNFTTTSIYGSNISLIGSYQFNGDVRLGQKQMGQILTFCSLGAFSFIGIPLWCTAIKRPEVSAGILLYLEME